VEKLLMMLVVEGHGCVELAEKRLSKEDGW
jgi:hypothetical protein